MSDNENPILLLGESLRLLMDIPTESVDAVITDPPYSSGGFTRGDRTANPAQKYVQGGTKIQRSDFGGDNRDAHSWCYWMNLWMTECYRIVKPSGYMMSFTDWRQLPNTSDVVQAAGFVWRGIVVWDKGRGTRAPNTAYFRHQAEYVVWGTKGVTKPCQHGGPFDGVYSESVKQSQKFHLTGKMPGIMEHLIQPIPPGGVVLDPFMGSGTTGVACIKMGRRFIGMEQSAEYFEISQTRISQAIKEKQEAANE